MGLGKIFIYSLFSGLSFAFSYRTSGDVTDTRFAFSMLNRLSQNADEQIQAAILMISLVLAVLSIYSLAKFFRQIIEKRLIGIIIAALGFSGSFLVLSSEQQTTFVVIGAILWITGIILIILEKRS